jgi:hypothetical protein
MCGCALEKTSRGVTRAEGIRCPLCGFQNEGHVDFCRSCGAKFDITIAKKASVLVSVGAAPDSSGGRISVMSGEDDLMDDMGLDYERGDDDMVENIPTQRISASNHVSTRHESMLAKLDKLEEELEARMKEPLPEPEDLKVDERQAKLESLSSTLDALISDLLEVEINEYAFPDFIHPDESGFPSMDPASYLENKNKKKPDSKKKSLQDIIVITALITAIFLVGLSFGLWGSYFLGL